MRKIIPFVIILLLVIIIRNAAFSIYNATHDDSANVKLQKQIEAERKKQTYLNERLYYVKTDEFVEDEAKEKLGMLPPGEVFVIAPTESPKNVDIEVDTRPNWKRWWELFF